MPVKRLIMDGERPVRVPDAVIDKLKGRERHGLVVLPEKPRLDPWAGFHINERRPQTRPAARCRTAASGP
jgi:hypothetical protein